MKITEQETLLINFLTDAELAEWKTYFSSRLPDLRLAAWDDASVDPLSVRYVLVWEPEAGQLARFPHLRVILSEAAGVDHILADTALPPDIPITRMVTPETAARMADYVTMASYMLVRRLPEIIQAQRHKRWAAHLTGGLASETAVGILGLGRLGTAVAQRLLANGFIVHGWARSAKTVPGVAGYFGAEGLSPFLTRSQIMVNLLPDTAETRGIINEDFLAQLPDGAGIINVGRGRQLRHNALLRALDCGRVSGAILDVFPQEPLPEDDPLWCHPGVIVTSHVASLISHQSKAEHALTIIQADRAGQALPLVFDRTLGY
jgi:glyoxylate/hydroxypyruvate reductase A